MGWGIHHVARGSEDELPSLFRLLGGSTVVCSIGYVVEISGFEPEQTEPKSVVLPLHHISVLGLRPKPYRYDLLFHKALPHGLR